MIETWPWTFHGSQHEKESETGWIATSHYRCHVRQQTDQQFSTSFAHMKQAEAELYVILNLERWFEANSDVNDSLQHQPITGRLVSRPWLGKWIKVSIRVYRWGGFARDQRHQNQQEPTRTINYLPQLTPCLCTWRLCIVHQLGDPAIQRYSHLAIPWLGNLIHGRKLCM